jgi:hypothetical protein
MVVGDDVGVGDISGMLSKIVLDHFVRNFSLPPTIKGWLESNLQPVLGYLPVFHTLVKGWIYFELCFEF